MPKSHNEIQGRWAALKKEKKEAEKEKYSKQRHESTYNYNGTSPLSANQTTARAR